jgi:predicted nucleic acid-binding protein
VILAAYLDGGERTSALAIELLDELVRTGRNPAVVSMVSVLGFYREFPNLVAAPGDLDVAAEAASLRVAFGFAAPDALIVATGLAAGASHLVTNDRAWVTRLAPLRERAGVLVLGDLAGS